MVIDFTDEKLMNEVINGDLNKMSVLFERYHIRLYNFFLKLTFNKTISEDLTQNVFYRAIKYRTTFNEINSFKTWIYQIARNIHFDYCKQNIYQIEDSVKLEKLKEKANINNNENEQIQYDTLDKALQQLPAEQLELIVLSRFEGLKYDEIAKIKDTSVSNIKVMVHRTINKLREIYFKLQD